MSKSTPTEGELRAALVALRTENATLGLARIHSLLLATHPSWTVSEKRTRKVLQAEGLMLGQPSGASVSDERQSAMIYPVSNVIEELDLGKWTSKVEVNYFGRVKGKGLVAKEKIERGEVVWKEDPFIIAPEWYKPSFCYSESNN